MVYVSKSHDPDGTSAIRMLKLIKFLLILVFLSKVLISDEQSMAILLEHLSISTSQWGFLATRQVNHNAVLSATHEHEILIVALCRHSVDIVSLLSYYKTEHQ